MTKHIRPVTAVATTKKLAVQHGLPATHDSTVSTSPTFIETIERVIDGSTLILVDMRDLHAFLGSRQLFNNWLDNRKRTLGLTDGEHLFPTMDVTATGPEPKTSSSPKGGTPRLRDRLVTLETAKMIAMMENTAKGHQVRRYFIEVENAYQALIAEKAAKAQQLDIQRALDAQAALLASETESALATQAADLHASHELATQRLNEQHLLARIRLKEMYQAANGIPLEAFDKCVEVAVDLEVTKLRTEDRVRDRYFKFSNQSHHQFITFKEYYLSKQIAAEKVDRLVNEVVAFILTGSMGALGAYGTHAITGDMLFDFDELERWRHNRGFEVERRLGHEIPNPRYEAPV